MCVPEGNQKGSILSISYLNINTVCRFNMVGLPTENRRCSDFKSVVLELTIYLRYI